MNSMFKLFQEFLSVQSNQSKLVITSQTRGEKMATNSKILTKGLLETVFYLNFLVFKLIQLFRVRV